MQPLEKLVLGSAQVALLGLGAFMLARPDWIALKNRDDGETGPVTESERTRTQVAGVFVIFVAGYILYAIVTNMPGAEFFPA